MPREECRSHGRPKARCRFDSTVKRAVERYRNVDARRADELTYLFPFIRKIYFSISGSEKSLRVEATRANVTKTTCRRHPCVKRKKQLKT
jgi:hypothetical protein